MIPKVIDRKLLPHKSGVYLYRDKTGQIIYVGKALDLYHRVASYFTSAARLNPRTGELVSKIKFLETIVVESELEALILEANLIKKHLPPYNIRLTDDKDYLYIGITKADFPQILTARKADLSMMEKYWGPFPSSRTVKDTLKLLRRVFPWCSNPPKFEATPRRWEAKARACFYYHLDLCPGACVGQISKQDYQQIISKFSKFLDGKKNELVKSLTEEMIRSSQALKFEEAGKIKKTLEGINYLTQTNKVAVYLKNPNFLEDERQQALEKLQEDLDLPKIPERIEGYDISNISGKDATGSMVVLTGGEIDKSQYRKFKIRLSGKPNDVGMHREMIRRRLKHPEWKLPDLILVDGGVGQIRGVKLEIENWKLKIPLFGLAKRMEWLYTPKGEIIKLPRKSPALKLLQKLRDEAHRFAITYHRKLHSKSLYNSP